MRKTFCLCLLALTPLAAFAYGPDGHQIVGAIADERLKGTPAGKEISQLVDGFTLEKAAVIPDEIKGWDKKGPEASRMFHYSAHPRIDAQLVEFWTANQPTHDENSPNPSHHWFHYTDVPVARAEKYKDGERGRSKWDVVHMIAYCVDVLQNRIPEQNDRKITKPLAVILLTHYVGDVHQPLHVGAEYFDKDGHVDDPDKDKDAVADEGGNTLDLRLAGDSGGPAGRAKKLHAFWDTETVYALMPPVPDGAPKEQKYAIRDPARAKLEHDLATTEPKDWKLPAGTEPRNAGEVWANDILPIAKEAHDRLEFQDVHPVAQEDRVIASGHANEKPGAKQSYKDWSAGVVREELHKAGWRLADLLTKAVQPGDGAAVSSEAPPAVKSEQTPAVDEPKKKEAESPTAPETSAPVTTATPESIYGDYPANYKEIVTTWLSTKAPMDSGYIEWQGQPSPSDLPAGKGKRAYGYLILFNSRPNSGVIAKSHSALIRDGKIVSMSGFDQ